MIPRQYLPSQGECGFSYHIHAFPSCPPVHVQEGGAAAGSLNDLFWVSPVSRKRAAQPTAREKSLRPWPWPEQRCPGISPGISAQHPSLSCYQGWAGYVGRLLAQGIIIAMSNLSSTFQDSTGPFTKCSLYYLSEYWWWG